MPSILYPIAILINQFSKGDSKGEFIESGAIYASAQSVYLCSCILGSAYACEPLRTPVDYVGHTCQCFNVVYNRRASKKPYLGREWGLGSRLSRSEEHTSELQ